MTNYVLSTDLRYQIALALMSEEHKKHSHFCIELFEKLEMESFYADGFYYNYALLYYWLKDLAKAQQILEKEDLAKINDTALLFLLQLRFSCADYKMDKFFNKAKESNNAEILFWVAMFYEKKSELFLQKKYLIRSLLDDPENVNTTKKLSYLFFEGESFEDVLGKVYVIVNNKKTIRLALLDSSIMEGINAKTIEGCMPVNRNQNDYIGWSNYETNDTIQYQNENYIVKSIEQFSKTIFQYLTNRMMKVDGFQIISGNTPEAALEKIKEILTQQAKEQDRVFSVFNDAYGILPVSFLSKRIGCSYDHTWERIIRENALKINNYSTGEIKDSVPIMSYDAIITFRILGAFEVLNDISFVMPNQVKATLLAKITDKINEINTGKIVGELHVIEDDVYRTEHNKEYKKQATNYFLETKKIIEKALPKECDAYTAEGDSQLKDIFLSQSLISENYIIGLAKDKSFLLVTDEPFVCSICDAEKIPHMSAIHFLFNGISSHEKILSYLEKIELTNYLNYFNVVLYKKIVDSLERISLNERKEFEERFRKWLISGNGSQIHKKQVFNVSRELFIEDKESLYFKSIRNIGMKLCSELFPEEYMTIIEETKRKLGRLFIPLSTCDEIQSKKRNNNYDSAKKNKKGI